MEYLLGSTVTIITLLIVGYLLRRHASANSEVQMKYSQSYMYEMMSPIYQIFWSASKKTIETQSTSHYNSQHIQVVITKDKAYWIKDNDFLVAPVNDDGEIDQESAKAVDTMAMNKVQLEEIALIVEELTRGKGYDSRSSGQS